MTLFFLGFYTSSFSCNQLSSHECRARLDRDGHPGFEKMTSTITLSDLPFEITDAIFSYLTLRDYYALALSSHTCKELIDESCLWRKLKLNHAHANQDSLFKKLERCGHQLTSLEIDFGLNTISPRMIDTFVQRCPHLREIRVVAMVRCQENDLMTPLSQLTELKKISIKSNAEAFAPSFTCAALERWSGIRAFECEQITDALPDKNHNLDYEFIDLDSVVSRLTQCHGKSLMILKMHFPLRLRPINSLTVASLRNIAERCRRLENLWLNECHATVSDVLCLRELSELSSLSLDIDHGVKFAGAKTLLQNAEGEEPAFRKLRKLCLIIAHNSVVLYKGKRWERDIRNDIAKNWVDREDFRHLGGKPENPLITLAAFPSVAPRKRF